MRLIDLTAPIHVGMSVYPGDPEVKIDTVHSYQTHQWELRKLQLGSHTGTHVDAFSHMHPDGKTIDKIALERFFGPAQAVSVREKWPLGIGLFFTEKVDIEELDNILSSSAPFIGGEISESLERALLERNVLTYTGLVNLDKLPKQTQFMFYGFPLKISNGDGSPVRAVAIVND